MFYLNRIRLSATRGESSFVGRHRGLHVQRSHAECTRPVAAFLEYPTPGIRFLSNYANKRIDGGKNPAFRLVVEVNRGIRAAEENSTPVETPATIKPKSIFHGARNNTQLALHAPASSLFMLAFKITWRSLASRVLGKWPFLCPTNPSLSLKQQLQRCRSIETVLFTVHFCRFLDYDCNSLSFFQKLFRTVHANIHVICTKNWGTG